MKPIKHMWRWPAITIRMEMALPSRTFPVPPIPTFGIHDQAHTALCNGTAK